VIPGAGIRAIHFAGNAAGTYLVGGLAWLSFREALGCPISSDLPGLEYALHVVTLLAVFPLSLFVSYVLFRVRSPASGFTPLWRPWAAGGMVALLIWSDIGLWFMAAMEALERPLPKIPGLVFVAILSPFAIGIFFSHLLLWGPRPGLRSSEDPRVR
jgi:hypothetical protein